MPSAWRARAADGRRPAGRARWSCSWRTPATSAGRLRLRERVAADSAASASAPGPGAAGAPTRTTRPSTRASRAGPRLDPRSDAIVRRLTGWGDPAELRAGIADTRVGLAAPDLLPEPERPRVRDPLHRGLGHLRGRGHARAHPRRRPRRRRPRRAYDRRGSGRRLGVRPLAGHGASPAAAAAWSPRGAGARGSTATASDPTPTPLTSVSLAGSIRAEEMRARPDRPRALHAGRCDSGEGRLPGSRAGAGLRPPAGRALAGHALPARPVGRAEIARCECPTWKKTILRAMSEYGLYVGDTTGGTPWNIWFESGATYTSFGQRGPDGDLRAPGRHPAAPRTASTTSTGAAASTGAAHLARGGPLRGRAGC